MTLALHMAGPDSIPNTLYGPGSTVRSDAWAQSQEYALSTAKCDPKTNEKCSSILEKLSLLLRETRIIPPHIYFMYFFFSCLHLRKVYWTTSLIFVFLISHKFLIFNILITFQCHWSYMVSWNHKLLFKIIIQRRN